MEDLFAGLEINPCLPTGTFNTGTMWDLMTGNAVQGMDGKWYVFGGLSNIITALQGKGQTYKSTFAGSLIMRSMGIYPDTKMVLVDSENAISRDKLRLARFAGELQKDDFQGRIVYISGANNDISAVFDNIIKVCDNKQANSKAYIVETPIIDLDTMQPTKVWLPTFIFVDSLSELFSNAEAVLLKVGGLNDSKTKTAYMVDGNNKTLFLRTMRRYCEQYGIYLMCTAHIGEQISMDSMPLQKELQFQKQGEKTKNVGSKFKFLTGILAQTTSPKVLDDAEKRCFFPLDDNTPGKDLNEVTVTVQRCKNNLGGYSFPFVLSQSYGLLNTVSYFHYLRENNYYGLNGNKMKQQSVWLPDLTISRNTIRSQIKDNYQLRRALELTSHYLYVKKNWAVNATIFDFSLEPIQLVEQLNKTPGLVERILNSRGHWTYNDQCYDASREYLSIFDVLVLLKDPEAYPIVTKTSKKNKQ